jgi:dTDP-4-amino-4,6-dideoxy-D-glucose/dTDP-4-amino-2,4-dideoxy-beta-L-xylose transaminase
MIPLFKVFSDSDKISESLRKLFESGYIGQGPKVDEFERLLKEKLNLDYILSVNSATSGEHLAIHLLKKAIDKWPGIQEGDEILATPLTCTASNWPILANGIKIKWVDVDPKTLNMDLDDLARKITNKTKAIIVVHWGGYPIDLDRLADIQNQAKDNFGFKPAVIEDCAHAFMAKYKNRYIGSYGNICTFSFQAIKHLTCGDGGIVVLPHYELYKRGKTIRWYGIDREENRKDFRCEADILEWGFKFHMNDINATIGIENMRHIDHIISKHRSNAKFYEKELRNVKGIQLLDYKDDRESSYWLFTMLVDDQDGFMNKMKEKGIMVSRVHERNDKHTCVREYKSILPNLDNVVKKMICIPVGWWVTETDRQYIVDSIKEGW